MVFRGFYTVDIFDCDPFQMFTNGDDPIAVYIREAKQFEPCSMKLWCELARRASSILDIGAHVGIYSLVAASIRKDIEIHAFEPNPFNAARLRVNKHLNGFTHIVEHNFALADANGITELSWAVKPNGWLSSGGSLAKNNVFEERAPVYVKRLDDLGINPGPKPIIKIDVEGAEPNVFRGMPNLLKSRPTIILETFGQSHCDAINPLLTNYKTFHIDESGHLTERPKLLPADPHSKSKNQILLPAEAIQEFRLFAPLRE